MTNIKFSNVSIFLITVEIAVAVITVIPLSVIFGFFAILTFGNDGTESFYPEEIKPLLIACLVIFASVYALQIFQLLTGIIMLHSFSLMEINLLGTLKTSWFCLVMSMVTCCILSYLIVKTVTEYGSNSIFMTSLITFLIQKVITFAFLLAFNDMANPVFESQEELTWSLFRNVSNVSYIRQTVLASSLPFCLLKPKYIVDPFQLTVAITKALYNQKEGTMKTRSLQNEIIYCLSPSKNITHSLKTFGSEDCDNEILIVGNEKLFDSIGNVVQGDKLPIDKLTELSDLTAIKEIFGISEIESSKSSLLDSVVSRSASKDFY